MRLYKVNDGLYELNYCGIKERGTLAVLTFLYSLVPSEVDVALVDMLANSSNVAHFGVAGTFLFSERANSLYLNVDI